MRASYQVGLPHHRGIHSTFSNFEVSYGNASTPDSLGFIVWAVCRFDPVGFVKVSKQDLYRMAPIAPARVPLVFKTTRLAKLSDERDRKCRSRRPE